MSFFRDDREIVQVHVDDASGAILESWSGDQVAWTMARGYPGAFGRKLNAHAEGRWNGPDAGVYIFAHGDDGAARWTSL